MYTPYPIVPQSDSWFHIYFAATMDCVDSYEACLTHIDNLPPSDQGNALAVAARGWWTLGRPREAEAAWARAQALGGNEVDALAPFLVDRGATLAARRARGIDDPGLRADAWCDVAGLLVNDGALPGAARAIEAAIAACPDHAEALHWRRLFNIPDLDKALENLARPRRYQHGTELVSRDLERLLPRQGNGWLSPERHERRHMAQEFGTPPPASALERFRRAGLTQFYLTTPDDWGRVPADHPLVSAELEIDQLWALLEEQRPALEQATTIWHGALTSGDLERTEDVARLLCRLAFHELGSSEDEDQQPTFSPLAREACEWLLGQPSPNPAVKGFRAWFGATLGEPDAIERARSILTRPPEDQLEWRLAVGVLYRCDAAAEGAAEIARALRDPVQKEWARDLKGKRAHPEKIQLQVQERTRSRGLGGVQPEDEEKLDDWWGDAETSACRW